MCWLLAEGGYWRVSPSLPYPQPLKSAFQPLIQDRGGCSFLPDLIHLDKHLAEFRQALCWIRRCLPRSFPSQSHCKCPALSDCRVSNDDFILCFSSGLLCKVSHLYFRWFTAEFCLWHNIIQILYILEFTRSSIISPVNWKQIFVRYGIGFLMLLSQITINLDA